MKKTPRTPFKHILHYVKRTQAFPPTFGFTPTKLINSTRNAISDSAKKSKALSTLGVSNTLEKPFFTHERDFYKVR